MKLYCVKLRGMKGNYGNSYVIEESLDSVYWKVRNFLDKNDLGFKCDRELESIELLADEDRYSNVGTMLFL